MYIYDCFAVTYVDKVLKKLIEVNYGSLATVVGRYYAMDRDKRWERIKIAYEALVQGKGEVATPDKVIEVRFNIQMLRICYRVGSSLANNK